jgi:predicted nucleic acid-binding protein
MAEALAYFDSSVLAKLYLEEPGSPHARRLMHRYRLLSSVFAPVEVLSAISRRYRAGDLTQSQFDAVVARLHAEQTGWNLVEVTPRVVQGAEWLVQNQPVRTLDALHISSALIIQREYVTTLPFATADQRQREAAASAGLHILWLAISDGHG